MPYSCQGFWSQLPVPNVLIFHLYLLQHWTYHGIRNSFGKVCHSCSMGLTRSSPLSRRCDWSRSITVAVWLLHILVQHNVQVPHKFISMICFAHHIVSQSNWKMFRETFLSVGSSCGMHCPIWGASAPLACSTWGMICAGSFPALT